MRNTKINNNIKDEQYYIDLYDQSTVEECYRLIQKFFFAPLSNEIVSNHSVETQIEQFQKIVGIVINCFSGERYINKTKTIQEHMDKDRRLDELLENAQLTKIVLCDKCNSPMNCTDKHLYGISDEKVLFFFQCNKCRKNKAFFDSGEEFKSKYECPKCGKTAKATYSRKKNNITTKYMCLHCGFTEEGILDIDKETEEIYDEVFLIAKKQFCLSKEDGEKYIDGKRRLIHAVDCIKELKEKEKQKDIYDAVNKIKKLNIADLENLLSKELQKEGFIRLKLESPQLSRDVKVGFTIQDTKSSIDEYDRRMKLKKTIINALLETNWKLMDDDIYYKLGILTGRLRGLENEEDLVKLVQGRKKKEKQ